MFSSFGIRRHFTVICISKTKHVLDCLTLEDWTDSCPGTSVNNCQITLHNSGNIVVTLVNRGIRRLFFRTGEVLDNGVS
jgi:hypothetical protein